MDFETTGILNAHFRELENSLVRKHDRGEVDKILRSARYMVENGLREASAKADPIEITQTPKRQKHGE